MAVNTNQKYFNEAHLEERRLASSTVSHWKHLRHWTVAEMSACMSNTGLWAGWQKLPRRQHLTHAKVFFNRSDETLTVLCQGGAFTTGAKHNPVWPSLNWNRRVRHKNKENQLEDSLMVFSWRKYILKMLLYFRDYSSVKIPVAFVLICEKPTSLSLILLILFILFLFLILCIGPCWDHRGTAASFMKKSAFIVFLVKKKTHHKVQTEPFWMAVCFRVFDPIYNKMQSYIQQVWI